MLELVYGPGTPANLPTRLILKTMQVGPHAPPEMYETEVRFYTEIQSEIVMETPRCFGGHFGGEAGNFGILLEDLERRDARFPKATEQVSLREVASRLRQLAGLHAHFWRPDRFASDLAWVPMPLAGGMQTIFTNFGYDFVQSQVDSHLFKQELIAPLGLSVRERWLPLKITMLSPPCVNPTRARFGLSDYPYGNIQATLYCNRPSAEFLPPKFPFSRNHSLIVVAHQRRRPRKMDSFGSMGAQG